MISTDALVPMRSASGLPSTSTSAANWLEEDPPPVAVGEIWLTVPVKVSSVTSVVIRTGRPTDTLSMSYSGMLMLIFRLPVSWMVATVVPGRLPTVASRLVTLPAVLARRVQFSTCPYSCSSSSLSPPSARFSAAVFTASWALS